jgi:DNA-directed RNA polymerase specialized sigma24 family protein
MMKTVDHKTAFDEKVKTRLNSDEWDIRIARNVLRSRRRKRYTIAAFGSAVSLAVAASLIFAILPDMQGETLQGGEALNRFVNAQVEGTWEKVFAESAPDEGNETVFVDIQSDKSMDTMIDETLAQRNSAQKLL